MSRQVLKGRLLLIAFIAAVAAWRVLTYFFEHDGFFSLTPICAMALFGAAYLQGRILPFLIPIGALFISDVILCFTVYAPFRQGLLYEGWHWVYLSFVLIIIAGKLIMRKVNLRTVLSAMLVSSLIHWLVATLSECVQIESSQSFLQLYAARLAPAAAYELRILAGTVFYGVLLFGGYHLLNSANHARANSELKKV